MTPANSEIRGCGDCGAFPTTDNHRCPATTGPLPVISDAQVRGGRLFAHIPPQYIAVQRECGWPDIHPEDYCHLCGRPNPSWVASRTDWLTATAAWAAETGREGICCPSCFAAMHAAATDETACWLVSIYPDGPYPMGDHVSQVLTQLLGDAWDDGNAVGLDGWIGPGRGEEPDPEGIAAREKCIDWALDIAPSELDLPARDRRVAEEAIAAAESDIADRLSALLMELTGGRLSKTTYDVRTMVQAVEEYFDEQATRAEGGEQA